MDKGYWFTAVIAFWVGVYIGYLGADNARKEERERHEHNKANLKERVKELENQNAALETTIESGAEENDGLKADLESAAKTNKDLTAKFQSALSHNQILMADLTRRMRTKIEIENGLLNAEDVEESALEKTMRAMIEEDFVEISKIE